MPQETVISTVKSHTVLVCGYPPLPDHWGGYKHSVSSSTQAQVQQRCSETPGQYSVCWLCGM